MLNVVVVAVVRMYKIGPVSNWFLPKKCHMPKILPRNKHMTKK